MAQVPLKAYEDVEFLKSDVCRAVRLQLEMLKPEVTMQAEGIESTIVVFGSARLLSPEKAESQLSECQKALAASPDDPKTRSLVRRSEGMVRQSHYYAVAREFSALVSRECQRLGACQCVVVTGGGGGIMEAANRGAVDASAKSIGLNITLPHEQTPNPYISEGLSFQFHYFSIRKMHFLMRAKAMCAFPGGFGTMDELFEALTLIQTGKVQRMPIVLFGREFWEQFLDWSVLVERGLIDECDLGLFQYCETAAEAWDHILSFSPGIVLSSGSGDSS